MTWVDNSNYHAFHLSASKFLFESGSSVVCLFVPVGMHLCSNAVNYDNHLPRQIQLCHIIRNIGAEQSTRHLSLIFVKADRLYCGDDYFTYNQNALFFLFIVFFLIYYHPCLSSFQEDYQLL